MKKRVNVFCAASNSISKKDKELAREVGRIIAVTGNILIFGAGSTGAMGQLHEGYMESNPSFLPVGSTTDYIEKIESPVGIGHIVCHQTMHRRNEIYWLGDCCLVLGGGSGTFAEFWEFFTAKKLREWKGDIILLTESWVTNLILKNLDEMLKRGVISKNCMKYIKILNLRDFAEYLA